MRSTLTSTSASDAMIHLGDLHKTFSNASGETKVLKGINLTIQKGEFVAVVGKSGSGKSTLLNMITGIDHPTSGLAEVNGTEIAKMTESQRALWRGKNLGIVFQFFQLLPMLTLQENVMLPMDLVGMYDFEDRPKKALELLARVGLEEQAHKIPAAVSTGQQQKAGIARALATDPPIIIADEPTGNLDSRSADAIISIFDGLMEEKKTIVMVTHDPSLTNRTTRSLIISDGELVDETVSKCLPLLDHGQMLKVSHLLERFHFQPNSTILKEDHFVDYFYMIVEGFVEIVLCEKCQDEITVARLGPGQFFGEIELINGSKSIAAIRAAPDNDVELVGLRRDEFTKLLKDSPLTEDTIRTIVQKRLQENQTADRRRNSR
ncbi:ATP-binding cassette domain-containing protein [Chloroflexota bacterium]